VFVCAQVVVIVVNNYVVTSVLGGLKSLQSNEALMGFASSLEFMTMQMREVMIDSWGTAEVDVDAEAEENSAATATTDVADDDDDRLTESDTETEHYDCSVQSVFDEGCWTIFISLS